MKKTNKVFSECIRLGRAVRPGSQTASWKGFLVGRSTVLPIRWLNRPVWKFHDAASRKVSGWRSAPSHLDLSFRSLQGPLWAWSLTFWNGAASASGGGGVGSGSGYARAMTASELIGTWCGTPNSKARWQYASHQATGAEQPRQRCSWRPQHGDKSGPSGDLAGMDRQWAWSGAVIDKEKFSRSRCCPCRLGTVFNK